MRGRGNKVGRDSDSAEATDGILILLDEALLCSDRAMQAVLPILGMKGSMLVRMSSRPTAHEKGRALYEQLLRERTSDPSILDNTAQCAKCMRTLASVDRAFPCFHNVMNMPPWKVSVDQLRQLAAEVNLSADALSVELLNQTAVEERVFEPDALHEAFRVPFDLPAQIEPVRLFVGVDPAEGGARSKYMAVALAPHVHALWIVGLFEVDFHPDESARCGSALYDWIGRLLALFPYSEAHLVVEGNMRTSAGLAISVVRDLLHNPASVLTNRLKLINPDGDCPGRMRSDEKTKQWATGVLRLWINHARQLREKHAPCVRVSKTGVYGRYTPEFQEWNAAQACARLHRELLVFDPKEKSKEGDDAVMALILALMATHWLVSYERMTASGKRTFTKASFNTIDLDLYLESMQWRPKKRVRDESLDDSGPKRVRNWNENEF